MNKTAFGFTGGLVRGPGLGALGVRLCALFAIALAVTWLLFRRALLSSSVDMAHHGQLVDALLTHGQTLPRSVLGYIPVGLYSYPNFAHRMAAVLAGAGVDIVRAMNALAMASALFVWVALLDLQRRASTAALVIAVAGAVATASFCFCLIGGEVVGNFFFAQLVGEAVFVASALFIAALVSRPIAFAAAASAAVYVCANVHLMLAIKLAAVAMALWGLNGLRLWARRELDLRQVIAPIAVPLTLVLNPQIGLMRATAQNNGDIGFGSPVTIGEMGRCPPCS